MSKAVTELKIKAKRLQKSAPVSESITLKQALQAVAKQAGFLHWQHASAVLGGNISDCMYDYGKLWYHPKCSPLLNLWFANYDEAKTVLNKREDCFLVPYKNQFVVVKNEYLNLLGAPVEMQTALKENGRDIVALYNSELWDNFAYACIMTRLQN